MINLSLDELKLIVEHRNISDYKNKSAASQNQKLDSTRKS